MGKRKRHVLSCDKAAGDTQQPWPRENKLLIELRKQKLNGMLCDVVFVYENYKLYSHACVLAAFSPYMMKLLLLDHDNTLLQHDSWCCKTPLKINLTDILHQSSHICCECFTNVIDFMYTSKIYMYNCHLNHIEYAATMLQISELISVCIKYKESVYKKSKFNVDSNTDNVVHSNSKNRMHVALKLFMSNLNESNAVDLGSFSNSQFHNNTVNEYLEKPGTDAQTECRNSKKLKMLTFTSAQNSNNSICEVELKKQHTINSDSVVSVTPTKNPSKYSLVNKGMVKARLYENFFLSQSETDKINLCENISVEHNSYKIIPNNVKNILSKKEFLALIGLSEKLVSNRKSQTEIVNYTNDKNKDFSLALCENKEVKVHTEKNASSTIPHTTEDQFCPLYLTQENTVFGERSENSSNSGFVAKENGNMPLECTAKTKETVELRQSAGDSTSKSREEAVLNILETHSSNDEETNNNHNETAEEDHTLNKNVSIVEIASRSQLTDPTMGEVYTNPVENKDETDELTKKHVSDSRKGVVLTNIIESASSSIYQIVESIGTTSSNEDVESNTTGRKDNHESESRVFEAKKEDKNNIQTEKCIMKTNEKTKFCCEVCKYKTLRLSKIVEHLETDDHRQTSCSICTYTFKDNVEFKQHLKLHKENFPFQCLTCNKKFKSITYFKNHLQSHSNKKSFVCTICKASFKHSYNLSRHTVSEHSKTEEKYICEHCGHTSSVKHKLILHLQEHGFTLPVFTCSVNGCKFQTTRKINLTIHEKTHLKTESFVCETCGSTFYHIKNLKRHIREKHSPSSLKLQCSICDFTTNRKHSLNIHVAGHNKKEVNHKPKRKQVCGNRKPVDSNRKPYKCDMCEEQFVNRGNVRRHNIAVHNSGVFKIKCSMCDYVTTREDLYKKHLSKHYSTQTENQLHKRRKFVCKTNDHIVPLVKTVSSKENSSCQPVKNCTEMPKCNSNEQNISDNKNLIDGRENNNELIPHIRSTEETSLHPGKALSITNLMIDDYNKMYICEICGDALVSEENLQLHKSEEHNAQQVSVNQKVREDICLKSKIQFEADKLDRNNQTGNYIGVLIPLSESEVTNLDSNIPANLGNRNDIVLPNYNSSKENVLSNSHFNQQSNDNVVDMNFSLPLVDSSTELHLNEQTGQFCTQNDCTDNVQLNITNEEGMYCNLEPSEKQNQPASLTNMRTLILNEETGELSVIGTSGTIKHTTRNYSDENNICYNTSSNHNVVETSISNFCNTLNSESCKITRTCSDNNEHINTGNTQPSTEQGSSDVFSVHNVSELNRTIILNETTGEINIIIDNNASITNDSENGNRWQNTSKPCSGAWILDESTGTLTNVTICNEQTDDSLPLNKQRELISFPNQNTTVILNEGTGELTFITLNSDHLEENDNSDMFGNSHYFDDDMQSNFSVDSLEDFTFDNISLPSPVAGDEINCVTEFLNELTGEINLCSFTGGNNSDNNIINNTNYMNYNFKGKSNGKNNSEMTWDSSNNNDDDDEDLTFLNELTGEILESTSKINNSSSTICDSVSVANNSLPNLDARNTTNIRNEILNEITGELSVHLDDELTRESTDSVHLNKETGIMSWNALNQATSESNMLDKNADWFFENLQNDSLDSFTADDDNFPKQFQYNLFLSSPSEDLTLDAGTSDTLLNESTGELVSKVCSESQ